ncbi:hypothetical protein OHR68_20660 [Spirillospora sp. NBC_00431]
MAMPSADMHMRPEAVAGSMRQLDGEAQRLGGAWGAIKNGILADEAGIGGDMLGQAFRGAYAPAATEATQAADTTVTALAEDATVGNACAADYCQGDQRAREAIPDPGTPMTAGRPI